MADAQGNDASQSPAQASDVINELSPEDWEDVDVILRIASAEPPTRHAFQEMARGMEDLLGDTTPSFLALLSSDEESPATSLELAEDTKRRVSRLRNRYKPYMRRLLRSVTEGEDDWQRLSIECIYTPLAESRRLRAEITKNDLTLLSLELDSDSLVRLVHTCLRQLANVPSDYLEELEQEELDNVSESLGKLQAAFDQIGREA